MTKFIVVLRSLLPFIFNLNNVSLVDLVPFFPRPFAWHVLKIFLRPTLPTFLHLRRTGKESLNFFGSLHLC